MNKEHKIIFFLNALWRLSAHIPFGVSTVRRDIYILNTLVARVKNVELYILYNKVGWLNLFIYIYMLCMCVCIYTFARLEEIDDDENGDDDDGDDDAVQYIPMCVGEEKIVKPEFRRQDKKKTNSFFFSRRRYFHWSLHDFNCECVC